MKRTDLALEAKENIQGHIEGIDYREENIDDIKITTLKICEDKASYRLEKPKGTYITIEVPKFTDNDENLEEHAKIIASKIKSVLPKEGLIFVAGLGNKDITPDNLGPESISHILATRHVTGELASSSELLSSLRSVAAISPGVLGQTGIETGEILYSISQRLKPTAIIAIDALASSKLERLGCTVQISDTGISPGSGVGNARPQINILQEKMGSKANLMMVTPREVDLLIKRSAKLVALAINLALQENLTSEDILALVS